MAAKSKSKDLKITRIYDAPVKAVWDAWTDPKQIAQWWGPRGFTLTTHSRDLRTGGNWEYTMHGPDGTDYPNDTKYLEVEKYQRLVYDHGGHKDKPPMFRVTVTFEEKKGKTTMNMTMSLPTVEAAEETRKFVKKAGGDATWDRLAEFLAKETTGKEKFFIHRTFETPIETMFEMWTNPKHFAKWLAPTGFDMQYLQADIKPGATNFYSMGNSQGIKLHGKINYLEISKPNRLVYTQWFTDANGAMSRHPMAPTWPEKMRTTVEFTEEEPGLTRVSVAWEVEGAATAEEMQTFIQQKGGMTQGWTGSFDKLEEYLAKQ